MIDPPGWQTRISPRIFFKIQHAHGQKMIDPQGWQTQISPRICFSRFNMCMGKRWLTPPWWQTQISPRIFFKIQHAHGQRWLTLHDDRLRSHLEFVFQDSTCTWAKDDWPPHDDKPRSHLKFFQVQHAHGQKMIDPHDDRPGSHLEFFFKTQYALVKRWLTPCLSSKFATFC